MKHMNTRILSIFILACLFSAPAMAEHIDKKKKPPEEKKEDKYGDLTKKCVRIDGLITLYRDTTSGKVYIELRQDQLDKEFIYFNHIADAPVEAGYFRGSYGDSKIIMFHRNYEKLEIIQTNTNFYFDPANAISKSADANINHPILASEKIEVIHADKDRFIIDGDALFLTEKMQWIKAPSSPGSPPGALGNLSSSKTRIDRILNYASNTEVLVNYVYENGNPQMFTDALADPRNISILYQHSILEVPKNDFIGRADDPRIGYFTTQVNDMTSDTGTPYRDVIHRWNLVKKDPKATLSDPIEPITFWIENTTPLELRPIIQEACERWNTAFEKAGFTHAVVCKIQPDDATWDAGDIHYNVLRWTSTPNPPFGGYGPSFVNPRTGEILGADIMLELVALTNRVKAERVFKSFGFLNDDELEKQVGHDVRNPFLCAMGALSNHQLLFGSTAADVLNMTDLAKKEMVQQMLYRLVLHEVGHTLGLTHNMRASTMSSLADVKNPEKVKKDGLANSVMEYPAFNYQANPKEQTLYCDVNPGPYDLWVIEYGYSPASADPIMEQLRLKKIAERSTNPLLMYGNDADDMRTSGHGIDPDVNIYDLTNDPAQYAAERCDLVNSILPKMRPTFEGNGKSYEELLQAYLIATGEYGTQLRVMTRQIGGVHYDRSYSDQGSKKRPFEPVSEEKQKQAMALLAKYAFAPNAWDAAMPLYNYILEQRRGFNHYSTNEDPHIHARILEMQKQCLNHLLHEQVLQRITDSKLYGNTYTLDKVLSDLTNAIFQADLKTPVNTIRQNLQIHYVDRLIEIQQPKSKHDLVSQSMAVAELNKISGWMATADQSDAMSKAHRAFIQHKIKMAFQASK